MFYQSGTIESRSGGQQGCPLIAACHAMVQRSLPESLGLVAVAQGTSPLIPALEPPAELDAAALFADDGIIAGKQAEVHRSLEHLKRHMPSLGLHFSKIDIIPARPGSRDIDERRFSSLGCCFKRDGNFEVMKSPIGDSEWCAAFVKRRVQKMAAICTKLAQIPSSHAGIYLLRFQASRMVYTLRTTPLACCGDSIAAADRTVQATAESILGARLCKDQAERARMPTRMGGLGLQSLMGIADAAYLSSCSNARGRVDALTLVQPSSLASTAVPPPQPDGHFEEAAMRLAGRLPGGRIELNGIGDECDGFRQQRVALAVRTADADRILKNMNALDQATFQASCAPGACRWLLRAPAVVGDTVFPNNLLITSVMQLLGVASTADAAGSLCKFCGMVRDARGIHDRSCTGGGDITMRHNAVRDLIFAFAARGFLKPVLERVGLLSEPGVLLDLRRPADVLIESALNSVPGAPGSSPMTRLALDVKVINALGAGHLEATRGDPLAAAEAYHDKALNMQQTAALCDAQGVTYVPMVFTAQGGIARRAEAILHQIAAKVAEAEGLSEPEAFDEIAGDISVSLARHGARSTLRRCAAVRAAGAAPQLGSATGPLWLAVCRRSPAQADAEAERDEDDDPDEDSAPTAATMSMDDGGTAGPSAP